MFGNVKIEKFKLKKKPKRMVGEGGLFPLEISPATEVSFPDGGKERVEKVIIKKGEIETDGLELEKGRYVTFETLVNNNRCRMDNNALVFDAMGLEIKLKVEKGELEEILEGIDDNFDLTVEQGGFIGPKSGYHHQKTYLSAADLETITNTICQYIKNHQDQFILSEDTLDVRFPRGVTRP